MYVTSGDTPLWSCAWFCRFIQVILRLYRCWIACNLQQRASGIKQRRGHNGSCQRACGTTTYNQYNDIRMYACDYAGRGNNIQGWRFSVHLGILRSHKDQKREFMNIWSCFAWQIVSLFSLFSSDWKMEERCWLVALQILTGKFIKTEAASVPPPHVFSVFSIKCPGCFIHQLWIHLVKCSRPSLSGWLILPTFGVCVWELINSSSAGYGAHSCPVASCLPSSMWIWFQVNHVIHLTVHWLWKMRN